MIHSRLIHHDHDQIDGLSAQLQTPASTSDRDRRRRAPGAGFSTTGRDTLAMVSSDTFADALSRLSISDWFFSSSADHPETTNREQMPSTSRHLTHAEGSRVMFFLFCALLSTLSTGH